MPQKIYLDPDGNKLQGTGVHLDPSGDPVAGSDYPSQRDFSENPLKPGEAPGGGRGYRKGDWVGEAGRDGAPAPPAAAVAATSPQSPQSLPNDGGDAERLRTGQLPLHEGEDWRTRHLRDEREHFLAAGGKDPNGDYQQLLEQDHPNLPPRQDGWEGFKAGLSGEHFDTSHASPSQPEGERLPMMEDVASLQNLGLSLRDAVILAATILGPKVAAKTGGYVTRGADFIDGRIPGSTLYRTGRLIGGGASQPGGTLGNIFSILPRAVSGMGRMMTAGGEYLGGGSGERGPVPPAGPIKSGTPPAGFSGLSGSLPNERPTTTQSAPPPQQGPVVPPPAFTGIPPAASAWPGAPSVPPAPPRGFSAPPTRTPPPTTTTPPFVHGEQAVNPVRMPPTKPMGLPNNTWPKQPILRPPPAPEAPPPAAGPVAPEPPPGPPPTVTDMGNAPRPQAAAPAGAPNPAAEEQAILAQRLLAADNPPPHDVTNVGGQWHQGDVQPPVKPMPPPDQVDALIKQAVPTPVDPILDQPMGKGMEPTPTAPVQPSDPMRFNVEDFEKAAAPPALPGQSGAPGATGAVTPAPVPTAESAAPVAPEAPVTPKAPPVVRTNEPPPRYQVDQRAKGFVVKDTETGKVVSRHDTAAQATENANARNGKGPAGPPAPDGNITGKDFEDAAGKPNPAPEGKTIPSQHIEPAVEPDLPPWKAGDDVTPEIAQAYRYAFRTEGAAQRLGITVKRLRQLAPDSNGLSENARRTIDTRTADMTVEEIRTYYDSGNDIAKGYMRAKFGWNGEGLPPLPGETFGPGGSYVKGADGQMVFRPGGPRESGAGKGASVTSPKPGPSGPPPTPSGQRLSPKGSFKLRPGSDMVEKLRAMEEAATGKPSTKPKARYAPDAAERARVLKMEQDAQPPTTGDEDGFTGSAYEAAWKKLGKPEPETRFSDPKWGKADEALKKNRAAKKKQ